MTNAVSDHMTDKRKFLVDDLFRTEGPITLIRR